MAIRVDFESAWLFCPDAGGISVGCEPAQRLQATAAIVGVENELEVLSQLIVPVVIVTFDSGIFDGAVHSLDLAVGSRMVRFGEPMVDAVLGADLAEAVHAEAGGSAIAVARQVGKLDAIAHCEASEREPPMP